MTDEVDSRSLGNEGAAAPSSMWAWTVAAAAGVAVALTAPAWSAIFAGDGVVIGVCLAAALGAVGGRLTRSSPFSVVVVAATAAVLVALLLGAPRGLAVDGLLLGSSVSLLAIPVGVAGGAALLASGCFARTAIAPLGVAAVVAAHLVAMLYTVGQRDPSPWVTGAVVACALIALLAGRRSAGDDLRWQPLVALGLATGVAVPLAFVVDGREPFDLRERLDPPLAILDGTSPLSLVKAGLVEDEPEEVFTLRVDGLAPDTSIDRIPVAVLDSFDGAVWSSSARFVPAGVRLPAPALESATGEEVAFELELAEQYPFRQLPLAGVVASLEGDGLYWDAESGMVATRTPPEAGLVVTGTASVLLDVEAVGEPGGIGGYASYPAPLPEEVEAFASSVLQGDDAAEWLIQLEDALRSRFGYSEEAPGGHSLGAIREYVSDPGRLGFAEQSTATFALVARRVQLPTRIVVGYRLETPLSADAPATTVIEDQIDAWPEVWFEGAGWVAFDPTDRENSVDAAPLGLEVAQGGADPAAPVSPLELEEPEFLPEESDSNGWRPPLWLILLVALPVVYVAAIRSAKLVRRSRRRSNGDAARRVVAAWHETEDQLLDAGRHPHVGSSVIDLRDRLVTEPVPESTADAPAPIARSTVVSESLERLAVRVDEAIYAPELPDDEAAEEAWSASNDALGGLRSDWSTKERMWAALSARSLFRRR